MTYPEREQCHARLTAAYSLLWCSRRLLRDCLVEVVAYIAPAPQRASIDAARQIGAAVDIDDQVQQLVVEIVEVVRVCVYAGVTADFRHRARRGGDADFAKPQALADRQAPTFIVAGIDGELAVLVKVLQLQVAGVPDNPNISVDVAGAAEEIVEVVAEPATLPSKDQARGVQAELIDDPLPHIGQPPDVLARFERADHQHVRQSSSRENGGANGL